MYEYATQNKFDCLIIANEEPRESKFRKNFLEILDPSEYEKGLNYDGVPRYPLFY